MCENPALDPARLISISRATHVSVFTPHVKHPQTVSWPFNFPSVYLITRSLQKVPFPAAVWNPHAFKLSSSYTEADVRPLALPFSRHVPGCCHGNRGPAPWALSHVHLSAGLASLQCGTVAQNDFCGQERDADWPTCVRRLTDQHKLISVRFCVAGAHPGFAWSDRNFTFTSMKDSGAAPLTSFLAPFPWLGRHWLWLEMRPLLLKREREKVHNPSVC